MESKHLHALSDIYMEAVYGGTKKKEEKKDTRMVVTRADKSANTPAYQKYKAGDKAYKAADHLKEDELQEKQKDTPDQVKAVIAYDKARKATDDATYDTEHGDKKQAKKEKDYAKWQRDTGARDAQKSGHPWEHAKGSTREKEGKKSEKHTHVKDSYEPSEFIQKLVESGKFSEEEIGRMIEVDRLGKSQVSESGWHRRNPDKVGTPEDPDYDVLKGRGKPVKDSKPATTGPASKKPPGIYKPDKDGKMVRQPD